MITCSDGEFLPLMVHDKNGNQLTLLQLSKQLWTAVGKLQKSEIVKEQFLRKLKQKQEFRGRRHRTCWRKSHRSLNQNVVIK